MGAEEYVMSVQEIMAELETYGSEQTRKTLMKHGAQDPFYGVKVGDLKKIVKRIKVDHALAKELYATGNSDAMYLAGLIADPKMATPEELEAWVRGAYWYMLAENTVAWVAAESPHGWELGLKWIDDPEEMVQCAGWCTLHFWAQLRPDDELDIDAYRRLLDRVEGTLHDAMNRVRYTMNGFVIGVGAGISELTDRCRDVAATVGKVKVSMGSTNCKVPDAAATLDKISERGKIGVKKKKVRC